MISPAHVSVIQTLEDGGKILKERVVQVDTMQNTSGGSHFPDGVHRQLRRPDVDGGHPETSGHDRSDGRAAR